MRIILAGIIGRYPWGGVTWCSLMYLLGLHQLGHDVYYLEDTCECNYDPDINALATDPSYAVNYIHASLLPFGFGDRWCYVDYLGKHHGMEKDKWHKICKSADLFLVLSGGCWVLREPYITIPIKAFIDSDPAFTQISIHEAAKSAPNDPKKNWYARFFESFDRLFTFGRNIGTPLCNIPLNNLHWLHTWQPVCTDLWNPLVGGLPARNAWTTVMTWKIESFQDIGGNKDQEFLKIIGLAKRCKSQGMLPMELAVNGPRDFLTAHGWQCVDAFSVSRDLWRYHSYISTSRGEFSVAKHTYVQSHCGWFSDRTACYLAAGRPAVVQDTGFTHAIPTGEGLLTWKTEEEAFEALCKIELDYGHHARAARKIAMEAFDSEHVLKDLLGHCQTK